MDMDEKALQSELRKQLEDFVVDLRAERDPMNAPWGGYFDKEEAEVFPVFTVGKA